MPKGAAAHMVALLTRMGGGHCRDQGPGGGLWLRLELRGNCLVRVASQAPDGRESQECTEQSRDEAGGWVEPGHAVS